MSQGNHIYAPQDELDVYGEPEMKECPLCCGDKTEFVYDEDTGEVIGSVPCPECKGEGQVIDE